MIDTASSTSTLAALDKIGSILAATDDGSADAIEARFVRAGLLVQLDRLDEAKAAYVELLSLDPTHFGALNDFGNLLYATRYRTAARTVYTQAVTHHPDNPTGHVNLANLLLEDGELDNARNYFEAALAIDPDHREANRGIAYVLTQLRDEAQAVVYRRRAFEGRAVESLPYRGAGSPIELLMLVSASGGMIPMRHHLDDRIYRVTALFVEFHDEAAQLPPHDVVFNAIGDADLCREALVAAMRIAEQTRKRVVNDPTKVLQTARATNAARLGKLDGVTAPRMALLPRDDLESPYAGERLAALGFAFPLLLRAPGFHTGRFFTRVNDVDSLVETLSSLPGEELMVIQFLDVRSPDGKTRKFRAMMIDGALHPLHLAISQDWKIHYFTAEMADNPAHRAEDAAFLEDMPGFLGPRATEALERVRTTLGLDYGGIDFSVLPNGDVVVFEANAMMVVNPPDADARWDYRRPAVQRVLDAIQRLLRNSRQPDPRSEFRWG